MNRKNEMVLFWASFLTLIAAGMGFSIRMDILTNWGRDFGFTQTDLGEITGMGLFGFGLTIIFFSDIVGYGSLMVIAFLLHVAAVVTTLAAPFAYQQFGKSGAYWALYLGQFAFSLGNGTCEAVINPLTATLFPRNRTHWLNILHAGWPGGLVLGSLLGVLFNKLDLMNWQIRWSICLLPMIIYGLMMIGRPFPRSEAAVSGVSLPTMIATLFFPVLLFVFFLHALVGYVELGTDSWIGDITKTVLGDPNTALLAFAWTNILMFTLRFFAGPIVHKISPLGLLFGSAVLGTLGLVLLGMPFSNTTWLWLAAVTVYGIGKTFYWPTMLGVISERYPRGGALALGMSGGIGMISAGLLGGPCIGYKQDYAATTQLQKDAPETYKRYTTSEPQAPLPGLPKIAGLDNAKIGVLVDYEGIKAKEKAGTLKPEDRQLQIEKDLKLLAEQNRTDANTESTKKLLQWWQTTGQPHAEEDSPLIEKARLYGGKTALTWTAFVPAAMAVGYLLLILYFKLRGGYKAEVLVGHAAYDEKFTGGTEGPSEG